MSKMNVTYYDIDGNEMECAVNADDEAAALGVVLDELGDTICSSSPFAIWRDRAPRRKAAGGRKANAKGKLLSEPVPTGENLYDEDEAPEATPLPETTENPAAVDALFASLGIPLETP